MRNRFQLMDTILLAILLLWTLVIILPFINVLAASFSTPKEYMDSPLMLFPANPTLENYKTLFQDGRIWTGYRTTLTILVLGVPLNMFLSTSVAYALSRPAYPLQKFFLYAILFTMLFNGGIVPLYLLMLELKLTNKIWSVILAYGVNNFYMIIMRSYFLTIPDSLLESARLDGANEWRILAQIVLPLSMPIIATMILFYSVDRWNEWFNAMIFIRKNNMIPLQLVLRNMVLEASAEKTMMASHSAMAQSTFSTGIKMGAVIVTIAPIMCVFPFLQRYFVKGIMIGAIKA
ncbi:MAG: carbohydrate ABC transporter permease [Clostridiales bacterium]|nr:carbohydrate ABC transporter permease [Clostridiales bacterium]